MRGKGADLTCIEDSQLIQDRDRHDCPGSRRRTHRPVLHLDRNSETTWQAHALHPAGTAFRDPYWPELAGRVAAADRAGIDIAGMLTAAAQQRPLLDEHPAAALWWRLSGHLAPAALGGTPGSGAATLRPAWTGALLAALPADRAERVLADPAWPALVAAVNTGLGNGWTAEDLLVAATRLDADAAAYGGRAERSVSLAAQFGFDIEGVGAAEVEVVVLRGCQMRSGFVGPGVAVSTQGVECVAETRRRP